MRVGVGGESLELLPERAAWWERTATLVVADVHLGKGEAFRAAGVPVPMGPTESDLERIGALIQRRGARRVIVLGDLMHAKAGWTEVTRSALGAWRESISDVEVVLVRGNHDAHAGDPAEEFAIRCVDEPEEIDGLVMRHVPPAEAGEGGFVLCGHVHPYAALRGGGGVGMRAPCFWMRPGSMVFPAFGTFTGGVSVRPRRGERIILCGPGVVAEAAQA